MTCWDVIGIAQTKDRGDIRRAYAARLKTTNPEDDPEGFKALRTAYEQALAFADRGTPPPAPTEPPVRPPQRVVKAPVPDFDADGDTDDTPDPGAIDHWAHRLALNRLQACLQPGAAPEALMPAFDSVIDSPAMQTIDVRRDTEERIAWILSQNIPRSDPLIGLAIDYFEWDSRDARRRLPRAAVQVLRRQEEVDLLRALTSRDNPHHKAFKILSAPPRPITIRSRLLSPAKPEAIAAFLSDVLRPPPSLRNDLNADTVTAWQAFLERPHLAAWGLWSLVLSLPSLVVGGLFLTIGPPDYRSLGILTVLPPAFGAAALVYTLGIDLPRRRWRAHRGVAPPWQTWGWIVSMALLLIAVALPLGGWLLTGIVTVMAVTTTVWIIVTGEPDDRPGRFPLIVNAALGQVSFSVWTMVSARSLPLPVAARLLIMLIAVLVVSACGRIPLHRAWASASPRMRRGTAFGVALTAAIGVVALSPLGTAPGLYPAIIAIVAAMVLVHRCIYLPSKIEARRALWLSIFPAGMFMANAGTDGGIVIGSSMILIWIVYVTLRTGFVQRSRAK